MPEVLDKKEENMSLHFEEKDGIGLLTFDMKDSPVNLLSGEMLTSLDRMLDDIKNNTQLKAVVFRSNKKAVFIAGADIKEIEKIVEPADGAAKAKVGQDLFNKIEDLSIPTIAVVDGVALGGGCELILSCDYRIATYSDKVKIGLPEVNLGFVPGFGGTYRLPRLVGLQNALTLILTGKPIDYKKAKRFGLVDAIYPSIGLDKHVSDFIQSVLDGKISRSSLRPKKEKGIVKFLNTNRLGQMLVFHLSKKNVLKMSKGFYPAPLRAIEVIKGNLYCGREKGLAIESKAFGDLAITPISKNLVHLFYLSEKFKKLKLDGAEDIKGADIQSCGVLGAGIMGGGIAQIFAYRDMSVRIKDLNHDAIGKGFQAASKVFQGLAKKRRLSREVATAKMDKISGTLDYSGFGQVDIVVEAVLEKMEVKQQVFKELSEVTKSDCVLATNTSALSVAEISKTAADPSRVIGLHFFNPVHRMPLVEIITTDKTSKETIVTTLNLAKKLGKTPILVKDSCGFIVNRLLLAYINEAGRIIEECAGQMEAIDKVMTDFGMPMGPFLLSDEVGLDVGVKVLTILEGAFGERFSPTHVFNAVHEKGLLGKKSGEGFYLHKKKREVNPVINGLLTKAATQSLVTEDACDRMVLTMVNEASLCLQENIIDGPDAIDVGMIFGTGFPPFRGGLLRYADQMGIDSVIQRLQHLKETYQLEHLAPSQYLLDLKAQGRGFYS